MTGIPGPAGTNGTNGADWAPTIVPLTSLGGRVPVNLAEGSNFSHLTTEVTVVDAPKGGTPGQGGRIEFTQGSTPRSVTFNAAFTFPGGERPALTQVAGAVDVLSYYYVDSTHIRASLAPDFAR